MKKNEVHFYSTSSGRCACSHRPLNDASCPNGIVDIKALTRNDAKKLLVDAPSKEMAVFVAAAHKVLASCVAQKKTNAVPADTNALTEIAELAAKQHAQCLRSQNAPEYHKFPAYHNIYATNHNRFAVSQHSLAHAATEDPEYINEELLSEQDLTTTCFVSTFNIATFLVMATAPDFHGPDAKQAHPIFNEVVLDEHGEVLVRHGSCYRPLATTLQWLAGQKKRQEIAAMYHDIFKYQEALCTLYLTPALTQSV